MLRFSATIDTTEKIKSFIKMVDSSAHFSKEYRIITLSEDSMSFFRASDSVRVESMFELNCHVNQCFNEYRFEMGTPPQRLVFDISTQHFSEALRSMQRAEVIKFSIKQIDGRPVLRLKNTLTSSIQDIGIEFREEAGPDDYTIPDCAQESLTITVSEASTINSVLTSFRQMENKVVTIIANSRTGQVIFKARTNSEIKSVVRFRELSVKYKPAAGRDPNFASNEMSVTVNLPFMQSFCRTVPLASQVIELQIVNNTALRMFVHHGDGVFTMYLCNIDIS